MITTLAGGVGAARLLSGLIQVVDPAELVAIVNVGDDLVLHGLEISPDLDTVTYTLAGAIDPDRGWGLSGETWQAMDVLRHYGGEAWFGLGDRDLGTHLFRTARRHAGAPLSQVTGEIAAAWGLALRLLPVTDDELRTIVTVPADTSEADGAGGPDGVEISFQEYFVGRQHSVPVRAVRFAGAEAARPGPGVLAAIAEAELVVIAPSNPIVSIGPVLAVPGVRQAVVDRRADVVAVSPIVAGAALKGPADRLLTELGHESSVVGVARLYAEVAATLVIDTADADLADAVEAEGLRCVVADTIMSSPEAAAGLGRTVLGARDRDRGRRGGVSRLQVFGLDGIGEIAAGDDLAGIIARAAADGHDTALADGDVVVVTQKIVSKAEDRLVPVDPDDPLSHKPLVEQESVRILRRRGDLIISETTHGFVCANAGIDLSNVERGYAALLPVDSDRSARRIRDGLRDRAGVETAVIVSDTFGRTWRRGVTDVAIGSAGIAAVVDLRGTTDALGREMQVTEVAVVDEIAAAAELVMGKSSGIPVAVVRGIEPAWFRTGSVADEIVRHPAEDLFR